MTVSVYLQQLATVSQFSTMSAHLFTLPLEPIDAMAAITLEELLKKVGVPSKELNDCISDDHLYEIALFLTSWRSVVTYLGLGENEVGDVEREQRDEQDRRLKALLKWRGKFGFKATYRKLVKVLLSLAMADVAEKVLCTLKGINVIHDLYLICVLCVDVCVGGGGGGRGEGKGGSPCHHRLDYIIMT